MDDDYENDNSSFMLGSIHTLLTTDELPKEKLEKGPKVRMGFHPPERAWKKQR